jgi:hypothetical protein
VLVGSNPGLHIWSYCIYDFPGSRHPSDTRWEAYALRLDVCNSKFQPEDTLWLIDRLALGLLDGMTGNILGSKICGVDVKDRSMDWVHVHSGGTA